MIRRFLWRHILNENGILFQDKIGVVTPDLERLVDTLHEHGAAEVCMESTSIYWMPVWRILEPYFSLKLVNPYFIKQLPGKKSDIKDTDWIATCLLKDLIRGSYVPEASKSPTVSMKRIISSIIIAAALFTACSEKIPFTSGISFLTPAPEILEETAIFRLIGQPFEGQDTVRIAVTF
jgi:hypothetical protein